MALSNTMFVVMVDSGSTYHRPVAIVNSFLHWKSWFKENMIMPGEEVIVDDHSQLKIRLQTGSHCLYYPARTPVNPDADYPSPTHLVENQQPAKKMGVA
jgi:hypothetical protein